MFADRAKAETDMLASDGSSTSPTAARTAVTEAVEAT